MNATHDMPEILATRNEAWGFFGTTLSNTGCSDADAREIWDDVSCELIHEFGLTTEQTMPLFEDLYADFREKYGNHPIVIHTVRPATDDEIELWNWHHEMLARERRANTTDS